MIVVLVHKSEVLTQSTNKSNLALVGNLSEDDASVKAPPAVWVLVGVYRPKRKTHNYKY